MNNSTTGHETILLVDDHPDNLTVMKKVLQRSLPNVEIATFQKPEEVMNYVRTADVSVAIFDVQMPVINGIELCEKMKASEETGHIPVILVTSHEASSGFKAKGLNVGADDFLIRPIDNDELVARVKVALRINRAEAELRRRADQVQHDYQMLFEKMLSGFAVHELIFNADGEPVDYRFLSVNPAFEMLLNLRAEKVLGKTAREVFPGLEAEWIEQYARVVSTGESVHFEDYAAALDQHFDVTAFRTGENQFATSFSDITKRKQAENQIAQTAQEWQSTFDASPDAIWILDRDQRVHRSNKAARTLFNSSDEEILGKHCWEIVHGSEQPIHECPLAKTRKSLKRESMDLQMGDRWFLITADPILDDDGQFSGAVHVIRDQTVRMVAEKALCARNNELERFNKAAVGRELRMIELKEEINALCSQLGQNSPYQRIDQTGGIDETA